MYTNAAGPAGLTRAIAARGGQPYSSLPTASAFTRSVSGTCACGVTARRGNDLLAVLHDMTLRRGDAVMTEAGFRIFAGNPAAAHTTRDFPPLARAPDVSSAVRGTLRGLEIASLSALPHDTFVALEAPQQMSAATTPGFQALN